MSLIFFSLSIDFHISQFIFEPCHLLLEDEKHSPRYHGHTAGHVLGKKLAILRNLQSVFKCRSTGRPLCARGLSSLT